VTEVDQVETQRRWAGWGENGRRPIRPLPDDSISPPKGLNSAASRPKSP